MNGGYFEDFHNLKVFELFVFFVSSMIPHVTSQMKHSCIHSKIFTVKPRRLDKKNLDTPVVCSNSAGYKSHCLCAGSGSEKGNKAVVIVAAVVTVAAVATALW